MYRLVEILQKDISKINQEDIKQLEEIKDLINLKLKTINLHEKNKG